MPDPKKLDFTKPANGALDPLCHATAEAHQIFVSAPSIYQKGASGDFYPLEDSDQIPILGSALQKFSERTQESKRAFDRASTSAKRDRLIGVIDPVVGTKEKAFVAMIAGFAAGIFYNEVRKRLRP